MNRLRAKELLPIIQAYADGKDIQFKSSSGEWKSCDNDEPGFNSADKYRIKPEQEVIFVTRFSDSSEVVVHNSLGEAPAYGTIKKFIEVME